MQYIYIESPKPEDKIFLDLLKKKRAEEEAKTISHEGNYFRGWSISNELADITKISENIISEDISRRLGMVDMMNAYSLSNNQQHPIPYTGYFDLSRRNQFTMNNPYYDNYARII